MNTFLLIILIILLTLDIVLNFGERYNLLPKKEEKNVSECIVEAPEKAEIDKEEQEKIEKTKKAFENLMGYEYEDAIKRK